MKIIKLILLLALLVQGNVYAADDINIAQSIEIKSKILQQTRTILVSLPKGYEANKARYPVIYMLDGLLAINHAVGARDVLVHSASIPPTIIVGIKSEDRMMDFTPSNTEHFKSSGGADKFLNFMKLELIPFINSKFKTNAFKVLEGHSMAGLFTAHALINSPELFDAYIITSPELGWNKDEINKKLKIFLASSTALPKDLYFAVGGQESSMIKQQLKTFVSEIENSSKNKSRIKHDVFEDEGHMSVPFLANYHALKFIFSDLKLPKDIIENYSDEKFFSHETRMSKKYGELARQELKVYIPLALGLMKQHKYQSAVNVFERLVQTYKVDNDHPQNYAWLASAFDKNGNKQAALKNYKIALKKSVDIGFMREALFRTKVTELITELGLPK
ncbi:MAG: hypothetical protein HRU25_00840 [Psychrobium sp.]|nr:hypothetical protein [Psychrobium sp.]